MRIVGEPTKRSRVGAPSVSTSRTSDLVGVEPELGHRRAQLVERLRVRRAAVPEQQLDLWLRHATEARG